MHFKRYNANILLYAKRSAQQLLCIMEKSVYYHFTECSLFLCLCLAIAFPLLIFFTLYFHVSPQANALKMKEMSIKRMGEKLEQDEMVKCGVHNKGTRTQLLYGYTAEGDREKYLLKWVLNSPPPPLCVCMYAFVVGWRRWWWCCCFFVVFVGRNTHLILHFKHSCELMSFHHHHTRSLAHLHCEALFQNFHHNLTKNNSRKFCSIINIHKEE